MNDTEFAVEELVEIDKLIEKHEEAIRISWGGSTLNRAEHILDHYDLEAARAYNVLGSFVEHVIITLRAMEMIVKQGYGGTHRQRNARADILLDTIKETIDKLLEDKTQGYYFGSTYTPFTEKNWDFRRLVAENQRLKAGLERLQNEIARTDGQQGEKWNE